MITPIHITNGTYILFDNVNKKVLTTFEKRDFENEKAELENEILNLPTESISDSDLLAWAKENYHRITGAVDYSILREKKQQRLQELDNILSKCQ